MDDWNNATTNFQRDIDMIKNETPNFIARLQLIMPEEVYMNMLHCTPPLPMLGSIISGNPNAVLSPPVLNNATIDTYLSKGDERRRLRKEVVESIRRLFNVMKFEPLYDLLSGNGRFFLPRARVHYCDVFDEVTKEEELEYLREKDLPADRLNFSSNDDI